MMKDCLQFLIEPAKKLKFRLKETRKRVKHVKKEPLTESQLFIMELARELDRICQRSDILAHIWTGEDVWPPQACREFIVETANILEMKEDTETPMQVYADLHPEKRDWKNQLLSMLEQGGEYDLGPYKRIILDWTRGQRNRHPHGIWPGEAVLMMLDDVELQWKRGHQSHLQSAVELLIGVVLGEHLDKVKSFYDTQKRAHIYTYSKRFTEKLYPVFGTVEMVREMVIRPADLRERCLCKGQCLFC
ncbi:uncharacterized protein LOC107725295 [Sinocyclocheilus rhinocerous]|uniref:Uncharacterized LOC107725295 n=1 Tax=Sinocyclocheilus rhinocerous TaxID=307959 RepID=A0A673LZP3_9TELE|nr:PREDICTED: uncharacterized protein LOC107725295 [Sinocyclocheilus rhinocerous]